MSNLPADYGSGGNDSRALELVNWITGKAIDGIPPLASAEKLAQEYLADKALADHGKRIDSLINWETTKNFTSGFITNLGGLITLPFAVPAAFGASWVIQARMSAAIARISGFDLSSDRVKTFVVVCLVGDALKDIAKAASVQIGTKMTKSVINQIPGKLLTEINQRVGQRLITKAGTTGAINLGKAIPLVGGAIGGTFDGYMCRVVGRRAKDLFHNSVISEESGDE